MSLKTNESAQTKRKSLRDFFGDNLTESTRSELEMVADNAARDLTLAVYPERAEAYAAQPVSDGRALDYLNITYCGLSHGMRLSPDMQWPIMDESSCKEYTITNELHASDFSKTRWESFDRFSGEYPVAETSRFGFTASVGRIYQAITATLADISEQIEPLGPYRSHRIRFGKLNPIIGLKTATVKVQEPGGKESLSVDVPLELKADNSRILPGTILHRRHESSK